MKLFIDQPHGIGDILFVQKIIKHYADKGFEVVVPVDDVRCPWIGDGLEPYHGVSYPIAGTGYEFEEAFTQLHNATTRNAFATPFKYEDKFIFLPIGSSYKALKGSMMTSKYTFLGLDWDDWTDYVKIKRHLEREAALEAEFDLSEPYTLVNGRCSTGELNIFTEMNMIYLDEKHGYTLFDWMGVIEKAERIITIDTSLVLLCEVMKCRQPLYVISRYKPVSFEPIEKILSLPWHFVPSVEELVITD